VEVGSVTMVAAQDQQDCSKKQQKQFSSLPSTPNQPLSETNFTNTQTQEQRKPAKHVVSRALPKELRVNVRKYLKQKLVYQDGWLTVKYYRALERDEGLLGVYTEKNNLVSLVTLSVSEGKLTEVFVSCSKAMVTRMLKNGLPEELKSAMGYVREIM